MSRRLAGAGLLRRPTGHKAGDDAIPGLSANAGHDVEYSGGVAQLAGSASRGTAPYVAAWTVLSGGTGAFDDDTALDAVFTPDDPTVLSTLLLTITDDVGDVATDAVNTLATMVANAGPNDTVEVGSAYTLAGSVTGGVPPYTYAWVKTSGDGAATFVDATDPDTDVSFDAEDVFVLTLTVIDQRGISDADSVAIVVGEASNELLTVDGDDPTLVTVDGEDVIERVPE